MNSTNPRFQDSTSAYRVHRSVTNEAQAISAVVGQYVADDFRLVRSHLRLLDAGTGDGHVLKAILKRLLEAHRSRPCEVVLKEYDFHHIEALLQNVAPMLRRWPQLTLFVTNRTFRQLQRFAQDLSRENTVCFDDIAGYRMLAMSGTSSLLTQQDSALRFFPRLASRGANAAVTSAWMMPGSDLWEAEQMPVLADAAFPSRGRLTALGDEIRAREIYDELAAAGARGKHFTVTIARQENAAVDFVQPREFFWDLAIVSHAFNRDRDPGWICRNVLAPLCDGLSIGGVLVVIQAVDGGQVSAITREIFGDDFSFCAPPDALSVALEAALDTTRFHLLSRRKFSYHAEITADIFSRLEPWQRELVLQQLAVSVTYHLQIPEQAWLPQRGALMTKIQEILERDGTLSYGLSIAGVKRWE